MPGVHPLTPIFRDAKTIYGHPPPGNQIGSIPAAYYPPAPDTLTRPVIIIAPTVSAGSSLSAGVVTASVSVASPSISSSVAISATTVTATATSLAPTVAAGNDANVSATVVTATASVLTPSVSAEGAASGGELFDTIGIAFDDPDFS